MSVSTGPSTGGDNVAVLLRELGAARREATALRTKLRRTRDSRDRWRAEAWYWKRGYLGKFTHGTPAFIRRDVERRQREAQN